MFPFGIQAEEAEPGRDARGADTVNRLLLHGARYHDRMHVFFETPDWRADRHAIRVGLVLHEKLGVGPGDAVALWMPLRAEWPVIERAIWGLGATSIPIPPDWSLRAAERALSETGPVVLFADESRLVGTLSPPESVRAIVALDGDRGEKLLGFDELLEYGGVLDTPERASRFRSSARQIPPEALASLEACAGGGRVDFEEVTHATWVRGIRDFLERFPPKAGQGRHVVAGRPEIAARIVLYAGWAEGLTETRWSGTHPDSPGRDTLVFGRRRRAGSESASFVNLADVHAGFRRLWRGDG